MNVHSFNDIEGLRIAAEMERRGENITGAPRKLSHSPEAVDMLLFLAEDEARHLAEFEKLARRVAQGVWLLAATPNRTKYNRCNRSGSFDRK